MWVEGKAVHRGRPEAPGRPVKVALDLRGLAIRDDRGRTLDLWPFANLARFRAPGDRLVIGIPGGTERIEIVDPATVAAFRPALKAVPFADRSRIPVSFLLASAGVAAIGAAIVGVALWAIAAAADRFAPLVPEALVAALDAAAVPDLLAGLGTDAGRACTADAGSAALDRLADRLADTGGARPLTLSVRVYRSEVANAAALPGGTIVVTSALIDRAEAADGFAGVLAHEIGHVHLRHGLEALLNRGGLALALSAVTGDASIVGNAAGLLLSAHYGREAEREADGFAVDAVAAGGGDATAFGTLLQSLAPGDGAGPANLLASHPLTTERREAIARRAADRNPRPGPLVDPADWTAIRRICG